MLAWWQMWRGCFPPELCNSIIHDGLTLPAVDGTIGHGGTSLVDKGFRRSVIRWVPHSWEWLHRELQHYFHVANRNAFGFDLGSMTEVQFTEYSDEYAGEYRMHTDNTWKNPRPYDRKLSLVVQLSEAADYEGCDLVLEEEPPEREELRVRGTLIVFPSFLKHGVMPIKSGKRYSLVAWFDGPKFR